jgi:hypothetical protein
MLYTRTGFVHEGHTEIVYRAPVQDIPRRGAPIACVQVQRSVGINGTCLAAVIGDELIGYLEAESREEPGRQQLHGG